MKRYLITGVLCLAAMLVVSCSGNKDKWGSEKKADKRAEVHQDVADAISMFRKIDPSMKRFFDKAHAYAIYPSVTKGAVGIGAAHGYGEVYRGGVQIGYTELTQGSIGLQLGGQSFSEIIFFKDKGDLRRFIRGDLEFSANASAVAARSGASATADYDNGVAVFTISKKGLMFEASIGGQNFSYQAK